jgi:hypothetical protein
MDRPQTWNPSLQSASQRGIPAHRVNEQAVSILSLPMELSLVMYQFIVDDALEELSKPTTALSRRVALRESN